MAQESGTRLKSHAELGKELGLYVHSEVVGSGLPLLTAKGATIKRALEGFIVAEEARRGYQHTSTPLMAKADLYKISGHWQHYKDSMFVLNVEGQDYALRPMTCPFHFLLYNERSRSYRELPVRYAEIATLFRNETTGALGGLTRLRQFTLADAHIMCTPEQLVAEFENVMDLIHYTSKVLDLRQTWNQLSKWDPNDKAKYIDNPAGWESSENAIRNILRNAGLPFTEAAGEAAFYGPKLDVQVKNVFGKEETLLTVQVDFALPERFGMTYVDHASAEQRPYVIHRSSIGCLERTMAHILEATQGSLPTWLSPVQVRVINLADRHVPAVNELSGKLVYEGFRADVDVRGETVNSKIRAATAEKIPYVVVIGDKEEQSGTLAVRKRGEHKAHFGVTPSTFFESLKHDIATFGRER